MAHNTEIADAKDRFFATCAAFGDQLQDIDNSTPCDPNRPDAPHDWWLVMSRLEALAFAVADRDTGSAITATRGLLDQLESGKLPNEV